MKPILCDLSRLAVSGPAVPQISRLSRPLSALKSRLDRGSNPIGALFLANAADEPGASAEILGLVNGLEFDDEGWALIPFGESHHSGRPARLDVANAADVALAEKAKRGVIQRFTREDAEKIALDARSVWGRIKRAIVGLPIFKGHPDAPNYAARFPDKAERGGVGDMQVTDRGLRFRPVLNRQGETDVESGWSDFSPYWVTRLVGDRDGVPIVAPYRLKSIGLVPRGNIPGLSLVNAAGELLSDETENKTMNKDLIRLLAAMGITLAPDAKDDAAGAAVDQALPKFAAANAAELELPTVKASLTRLETEKATLATEKLELANARTVAEGKATAAEAKFIAERKARAGEVVDAAITAGRVQAAKRDAQILELVNSADFDQAANAVLAQAQRIKTRSAVGDLKKDSAAVQTRQETVLELVNTAMEEADIKALPAEERYDAAFKRVEKKNPSLFSAMQAPGSAES